MRITNLRINGIRNPIGYAFEQVSLSYLVTETAGKALAFSRVEVSLTEDFGEKYCIKKRVRIWIRREPCLHLKKSQGHVIMSG